MPIHDWTLVNAGIFHHFHQKWITVISDVLNGGLLPADYYALAEQVAGSIGPDVLALQLNTSEPNGRSSPLLQGANSVAVAPPQTRFVARSEMDQYVVKQNTLIICHSSGDQVVALVEIVSPANKANRRNFRAFVDKASAALVQGYHLLIVDLQPPTTRDPNGIHGAIWEEMADDSYRAPADKLLTVVSYSAGSSKTAYVEPLAVGDLLPVMPLFLEPDQYVAVPLESTYRTAWQSVPNRWQRVLEAQP
jgi:hypothetical protein